MDRNIIFLKIDIQYFLLRILRIRVNFKTILSLNMMWCIFLIPYLLFANTTRTSNLGPSVSTITN